MPLSFELRAGPPHAVDAALLVVILGATESVPAGLSELDATLTGALARTLARKDFRGGRDEVLHLAGAATGPKRVMLVGLGKGSDPRVLVRRAASIAGRRAAGAGVTDAAVMLPGLDLDLLESAVVGVDAGAWEYADLKSLPPVDERKPKLERVAIVANDEARARDAIGRGEAIAAGYAIARRLAQMPGNLCTPELLADTAREVGQRHGLAVTVLGRKEMEEEKMGSFLSVAQGTPEDPKLVAIEYSGGTDPSQQPIVLVGKGLCFDTGGISIKPAERMEFMKFDMCGAAGVIGAMETIARLELPIRVIGVFGATTNMPSGRAVKPGDVVISQLGKSIEIINTDAEGRLVLADVLSYVRRFKPAAVIDAATLTGACVIALGHVATGVFGSDEALVQEVLAAGKRASEPGWQLPLWDDYKEQIKSDVADIKNTGGRAAGSITAALFLKEFAEEFPWVHLDIAGTAYSETDLGALPRGPTGVPVGTFVEFARGRAG